LPGGGGTTRLPRLVGAAAALDLILSGQHVGANKALEIGLVDAVVTDDLRQAAITFARDRAQSGGPHPVLRGCKDKIAGTDPKLFEKVRDKNKAKWRGLTAPWKIVECVEGAVSRSFDEAYAFEAEAFQTCIESPARKALVHIFFAERQAAKIKDVGAEVKPRKIRKAGVIGAGTMGGGIAMSLANAGIQVIQTDVPTDAVNRG
jgi:3-hydroxyacyl-CoA dehydrogenase